MVNLGFLDLFCTGPNGEDRKPKLFFYFLFVINGFMVLFLLIGSVAGIWKTTSLDDGFLYILTRQWPETFCLGNKNCVKSYPNQWTIHGLWPAYWSQSAWNCEPKEKFDLAKLKDLRTELEKEWPTLNSKKNNEDFWKHEWEKHGSCSKLTLEGYFNRTLMLNKEFDLSKLLDKIPANDTNVLELSEIRRHLLVEHQIPTHSITFQCKKIQDGESEPAQIYLQEIRICLKGRTYFECFIEDSCFNSDQVIYPQYSGSITKPTETPTTVTTKQPKN